MHLWIYVYRTVLVQLDQREFKHLVTSGNNSFNRCSITCIHTYVHTYNIYLGLSSVIQIIYDINIYCTCIHTYTRMDYFTQCIHRLWIRTFYSFSVGAEMFLQTIESIIGKYHGKPSYLSLPAFICEYRVQCMYVYMIVCGCFFFQKFQVSVLLLSYCERLCFAFKGPTVICLCVYFILASIYVCVYVCMIVVVSLYLPGDDDILVAHRSEQLEQEQGIKEVRPHYHYHTYTLTA